MVAIDINIEGAIYIERALRELGQSKAVERVLSSAVRAGASKINKEAKKYLKSKIKKPGTGNLMRGFKVTKARQRVYGLINWRAENVAPHAHLFEYGTKPRMTKKGAKRGQMPAQSFMRRSYEVNRREIGNAIKTKAWQAISREWRKRVRTNV